jgi:hypothetical protein
MLFLLQELYVNGISEKAKRACEPFPAHFNQPMHRQHRTAIGSLARYIGEALDGPPICHAFIMVEKSFNIPAILFYLASNAYKNKREYDLNNTRLYFLCTKKLLPHPLT